MPLPLPPNEEPQSAITDVEIEELADKVGYPRSDKEAYLLQLLWVLHNTWVEGYKAALNNKK